MNLEGCQLFLGIFFLNSGLEKMASILLRFCSNCSHLAVCHSMLGASGSDVEGEGLNAFWRLVDVTASDAVDDASPAVEGTASGRLIATTSASRIRDAFT